MRAAAWEAMLYRKADRPQSGQRIFHVVDRNGEMIKTDLLAHNSPREFRRPAIGFQFDLEVFGLEFGDV